MDNLLPCACSSGDSKLKCESDPCHYDTWDVVCLHCGASTSQFATKEMAIIVWNAMSEAAKKLLKS